MADPRIAICFPAAPTQAGYEMVRRSVQALRAQDCDPALFEVVVAVDGGDAEDFHFAGVWPFALTIVKSPRTPGALDVPHRNHTRNAAWRASSAPLCWMLDADFILPPHAIRHALAEHDAAISRGAPAVLSPCLWQFGGASTEEWWARSAPWADTQDVGESVRKFSHLTWTWPEWDRGVFSGFGEMYTYDGRPSPTSASVGAKMIEGMPILWRAFLEACPFDEKFIGWGGDKISLIDVLRGLAREGVLDMRVLTSVTALHQPHATDPTHTSELSRENERRRTRLRMPIESRTLDWRRRIPVLVEALRRGWAESVGGAVPASIGASAQIAEVVDICATMAKRRWKPGAPIAVLGPHAGVLAAALERNGCTGVTREISASPHAVTVWVDPLDGFAGTWSERVDALGHELRAKAHASSAVVLGQRLDGDDVRGLRPVDLQTRVIKRSIDARTVKTGAGRYTAICGRL